MQQPTPLNQNDVMGPRVSSILRTITVMVLMAAVAGSGGAYWFYSQSNQLLKMEVLRQLAALAPDLKFGIERANFDFSGRACLYGLSVQLPQEVEPALYIPETVITLDQQQMADFENVTIQRICVSKPVVRAIRHSTGRWNWQGIEIQNGGGYSLPDIEIEHGTVVVELERVGRTTHQMKLDELHLTALPSSSRQLKIALSMRIDRQVHSTQRRVSIWMVIHGRLRPNGKIWLLMRVSCNWRAISHLQFPRNCRRRVNRCPSWPPNRRPQCRQHHCPTRRDGHLSPHN